MLALKLSKIAASAAGLLVVLGVFSGDLQADHHEAGEDEYAYSSRGVMCFEDEGGECQVKVLVDESNLGGDEVEIAEIIFLAGYEGQPHPHQSIEIFYVLEGVFGHEVNGQPAFLEPGMIGIVRPGDTIRHSVRGEKDAIVLVIWAPGGEAARIFDFSKGRPIE